jgi:signal transduction histidine kinase
MPEAPSLISGPVEMLIRECGEDDREERQLQVIKRNGQRLLQMVNQLLDFSRLDSGRMKIVLSETHFKSLLVHQML